MLAACIALVAFLLVACGGDGEKSVTGVILDVQAGSLTQVESFTLRSNEGETLEFRIDPDAEFDPEEGLFPSHLRTHALAAEQVRVFYREERGELLALRLEHAGPRTV